MTKWVLDRTDEDLSRIIEDFLCITRSTVGCHSEYRCHVCQIFASSLNIYMINLKKGFTSAVETKFTKDTLMQGMFIFHLACIIPTIPTTKSSFLQLTMKVEIVRIHD